MATGPAADTETARKPPQESPSTSPAPPHARRPQPLSVPLSPGARALTPNRKLGFAPPASPGRPPSAPHHAGITPRGNCTPPPQSPRLYSWKPISEPISPLRSPVKSPGAEEKARGPAHYRTLTFLSFDPDSRRWLAPADRAFIAALRFRLSRFRLSCLSRTPGTRELPLLAAQQHHPSLRRATHTFTVGLVALRCPPPHALRR